MAVKEHGEIKGIKGIAVQEDGVTVVSTADTVNIVGGGTVTDVGGVATINIPQGVTWYREDVTAGSATYTFVNSPATDTSFLVFTDSGTLMFLGIDYTYDPDTETITFLSLGANESAYIWVAHALVNGGGIGDMVKAIYDPNNVQQNVYDYNYFINTPTIGDATLKIQKNGVDVNSITMNATTDVTANITVPTKVTDLSDASDYVTNTTLNTVLDDYVKGPASATDGNIALFDGATGKIIKDSGLNISITNTQPSGDECKIYYDNGTIYFYIETYHILLENGNDISTEDGDNILVLEQS